MKRQVLVFLFVVAASAFAQTADEAWTNIEKLRRGPGAPTTENPEQIVTTVRGHLAKQERALESFIAKYPSDPRRHEAAIELAGVNATLAASLSDRNRMDKAIRDLAAIERDKSVPSKTRADAAFQRITTTMQTVMAAGQSRSGEISGARSLIYDAAGNFATRYPEDRRAARLLAEAATLFDEMPERKRTILDQASMLARDEATKQRIGDDLKRLDLLGKNGNVLFATLEGGSFSLAQQRGKVTVLVFWAGWSPPSVATLAKLAKEAKDWPKNRVVVATVSLDENRNNCAEALRVLGITGWPTSCSGKVWQDPVARSLGINALATVFIYDTEGKLRSLNARDNCGAIVRKLLAAATVRR